MRLLVILALVGGCSHKRAPTGTWCGSYAAELRARAQGDIEAMSLNEANRRRGSQELLAMVGSDPAINVALGACSDANNDDPDAFEARSLRVIDLQANIAKFVIEHGDVPLDAAQTSQLKQLVEQLATTFSGPAPAKSNVRGP